MRGCVWIGLHGFCSAGAKGTIEAVFSSVVAAIPMPAESIEGAPTHVFFKEDDEDNEGYRSDFLRWSRWSLCSN